MRTSMIRRTPDARLAAWDPFRMMETLFAGDLSNGENLSNRGWTPAVDIRETEDAYEVTAELPGMKKEDVEITLENNLLKLSGERRFEKDIEKENYHRVERTYGTFSRAFSLPNRVDPEKVAASFADGILTVTVPKVEEAKPRRISIS